MNTIGRKIERRKMFAIHLSAFDISALDVINSLLQLMEKPGPPANCSQLKLGMA